MEKDKKQTDLVCISINQDQSCVAFGTQTGFQIFSLNPFKQTFSRNLGGGVGIIEMLFKSNILALVGGGLDPKFPLNKLILWDDNVGKCIGEMSFRSQVMAIRMKSDRILVALQSKIFLYNLADLKLLDHIESSLNPLGLLGMNSDPACDFTVIACLGKSVGTVFVQNYQQKREKMIQAHESHINALQINQKGTQMATASQKGTIIRIYNLANFDLMQELRRGSEYAQIHSISFHPTSQFIACSSETGTIHIFSLNLTDQEKKDDKQEGTEYEPKNNKSQLSFMSSIIPFLNSEWSLAQFRISDPHTKVCFGSDDHSIIVLSMENKFYSANFDPVNGGECLKLSEKQFEV